MTPRGEWASGWRGGVKVTCQDADVPPVDPVSRELTDALLSVIRERMEEQGLSGRGLSDRTGITVATLARQLKGETDLTVDGFDAIAVALGSNGIEDLVEDARRRM